MTLDYLERNKVTPPLYTAVSSAKKILDQLTLHLGQYHHGLDLATVFSSTDLRAKSQNQFAFTWQGCQCTFLLLPQGYVHSLTLFHNLVAKDLAT
jgi:hypothetical protein